MHLTVAYAFVHKLTAQAPLRLLWALEGLQIQARSRLQTGPAGALPQTQLPLVALQRYPCFLTLPTPRCRHRYQSYPHAGKLLHRGR